MSLSLEGVRSLDRIARIASVVKNSSFGDERGALRVDSLPRKARAWIIGLRRGIASMYKVSMDFEKRTNNCTVSYCCLHLISPGFSHLI